MHFPLALLPVAAAGALAAARFEDKALDAGIAMSRMQDHRELGMLSASLLAGLVVVEGWLH